MILAKVLTILENLIKVEKTQNDLATTRIVNSFGTKAKPSSQDTTIIQKTQNEQNELALGVIYDLTSLDEGDIVIFAGEASISITKKDNKIVFSGGDVTFDNPVVFNQTVEFNSTTTFNAAATMDTVTMNSLEVGGIDFASHAHGYIGAGQASSPQVSDPPQ